MKTIALFFIVLWSVYSVAHARKVMIPKFLRNKIDAAKHFMASQSKELFVREHEFLGIKWVYINTEKDPFYAYGHNNNASFVATWHDGSKVINLEHADIDINDYIGGSRRMNGRHLSALCASDCSDPNAAILTDVYSQWTIRHRINEFLKPIAVPPYRLCRKDGCSKDDDSAACTEDTTYNSGHEWNIDRGLKHYDGDTGCVPCKSGKYNNKRTDYWAGTKTPPCKTCANGQHTNNQSGAAICVDTGSYEGVACPAGKYVEFDETLNLETCKTCKSGFFSSSAKPFKWSCDKCPNGYVSSGNRRSCKFCPAGFEYDASSWVEKGCTKCAKGFYKEANEISCKRCPSGFISSHNDPTIEDYRLFASEGSTYCVSCNTNKHPARALHDIKAVKGSITEITNTGSRGTSKKYFTECVCPKNHYEYVYLTDLGDGNTLRNFECKKCGRGYFSKPNSKNIKKYEKICRWEQECSDDKWYRPSDGKCIKCPKFGFLGILPQQFINGYAKLKDLHDSVDFDIDRIWYGLQQAVELMSFCTDPLSDDTCNSGTVYGSKKQIACNYPGTIFDIIEQDYKYPYSQKLSVVDSDTVYASYGNCDRYDFGSDDSGLVDPDSETSTCSGE